MTLVRLSSPTFLTCCSYTGGTRKGKEGPPRVVPPEIKRPVYVAHPKGVDPRETDAKREKLIASNTAKVRRGCSCAERNSLADRRLQEIEIMREACKLGREVLDEAHRACRVGVTTDEIDRVVHEACLERKCYPSPLGYGHFPKSCCTSVNEVVCHGIPDSTELKDGDIINVDVSVFYKGMHADLNETYCVGNVDARGRELVAATYDCLWRAIAMCKPGVLYRDVGDVITKEAKQHKLSVVRTYCAFGFLYSCVLCLTLPLKGGHGVGELFHCSPTIPHYANNKATGRMQVGHIFTIEPMINEGDWKVHCAQCRDVFASCLTISSHRRCGGPTTGRRPRRTASAARSLRRRCSSPRRVWRC